MPPTASTLAFSIPSISFDTLERVALEDSDSAPFQARCSFSLALAIARRRLEFRFDGAAARDAVAERFPVRASVTGAGTTFFAATNGNATYFWSQPGDARVLREAGIEPRIVGELAEAGAINAFVRENGLTSLHAAAVALDGTAGAIVGSSTAGKTTTAFACGRIGLDVLSDERCLLEDGRVRRYPRALGLRRGGMDRLAADEPALASLFGANEALRVALDPRSEPPLERAPQLRALFALAGFADRPRLEPSGIYAELPAILRSFVTDAHDFDRVARAFAAFSGIACYRLVLGSPIASARAIAEVLASLRT